MEKDFKKLVKSRKNKLSLSLNRELNINYAKVNSKDCCIKSPMLK